MIHTIEFNLSSGWIGTQFQCECLEHVFLENRYVTQYSILEICRSVMLCMRCITCVVELASCCIRVVVHAS